MHKVALIIAFLGAFIAPAYAQKARIEVVNAKWVELFNKGHFDGIAKSLRRRRDRIPAGRADGQRQGCHRQNVEEPCRAGGQSETDHARRKAVGPSAAREIGTFSLMTKDAAPKEISGKYLVVWQRISGEWKLSADIWNDGK